MFALQGAVALVRWRWPKRGSHEAACNRTGLRRTDWVRITIADGRTTAEAIGVGYRLPAVVPITLPVAMALSAAGTPLVVRQTTANAAA